MLATLPTDALPDDLQRSARALGDPTRFRIFRYVLGAAHPVTVAELTDYTRLNHNAVRQHLAVLRDAGLVAETSEVRDRPGRPRLLYAPAPEAAGRIGLPDPHEVLARLLSEVLRDSEPPEEVGRRAGLRRAAELLARRRGRPTGPDRGNDQAARRGAALDALEAELALAGFRPSRRAGTGGRPCELVLERCPVADAAAANPGALCALHLGIARGLAEGLGGPAVEALVAHHPRRAGCRLVLSGEPGDARGGGRRSGPATDAGSGTGTAARRARPPGA